jgi:hypothetical protein
MLAWIEGKGLYILYIAELKNTEQKYIINSRFCTQLRVHSKRGFAMHSGKMYILSSFLLWSIITINCHLARRNGNSLKIRQIPLLPKSQNTVLLVEKNSRSFLLIFKIIFPSSSFYKLTSLNQLFDKEIVVSFDIARWLNPIGMECSMYWILQHVHVFKQ